MQIVVMVLIGEQELLYLGKLKFDEKGKIKEEKKFIVKRGDGIEEVRKGIERRDIVRDERILRYGMRKIGNEKEMKEGEYEIKVGEQMREVMKIIIRGK